MYLILRCLSLMLLMGFGYAWYFVLHIAASDWLSFLLLYELIIRVVDVDQEKRDEEDSHHATESREIEQCIE